MKTEVEIRKQLFAVLAEIQHGEIYKTNPTIAHNLEVELRVLVDILGEDSLEDYMEDIEKILD